VRFLILSNELPRLADTSGALAGRFIVLRLTESFYGREDVELTEKLLRELSGILNWSIDGWIGLQERGRFVQPQSSLDAIRELEDLGSPMGAFVRDRCEVGPGKTVTVDLLYLRWRDWCREEGRDERTIASKATFGRDLRAAVPGLRRAQPRDGDDRVPTYEGIGLI
jgi:putative DNA primase/helicase